MNNFSIVMPVEENRLPLLRNTIDKYIELGITECEFLLISRSMKDLWWIKDIHFGKLLPKIKIINYEWSGETFNPSMALNLGVNNATYNNIIITCPEVKPITNILKQLQELPEGNYVCQVFDQGQDGSIIDSLVNTNYRSPSPMMYFLACFQKKDLESINGWDEEFMNGYAWEDNDFGERFNRAGLRFEMRDEIQAEHQWHPRGTAGDFGWNRNEQLFIRNNQEGIIKCKKGLQRLE